MISVTAAATALESGHGRSLSAGQPGLPASRFASLAPPQAAVPVPTLSPSPDRRVWVRRPCLPPTTVHVSETDIIGEFDCIHYILSTSNSDDLKTMIINKYPTSLARTCDPADLVVELVFDEPKSADGKRPLSGSMTINASNTPISLYPTSGLVPPSASSTMDPLTPTNGQFMSPGTARPLIVELQPDESVFAILDHYFPSGMKMADAFVVQANSTAGNDPAVRESYYPAPPVIGPPPSATKSKPPTLAPIQTGARGSFGDTSTPPLTATTPGIEVSRERFSSVSSIPAPTRTLSSAKHDSGHSQPAEKALVERPQPRSVRSYVSNGSTSSRTSRSESSSGMLLLPRQFNLPASGFREEDNDDEPAKRRPSPPHESSSSSLTDTATPTEVSGETEEATKEKHEARPPNKFMRKYSSQTFPTLEGVVPQIHVLIVEDNVINQKILEAFMRRKRIRCATAKNGKEAVEKWRQGGFHLVLMDIQLPVMSGIEATKEIRRLEQDNRVGSFSSEQQKLPIPAPQKEDKLDTKLFKSPVIIVALTASSSSADKSEALAAGCNDFLTKPVNLWWLEQKIIEWGCMQALIDYEGWKHWVPRDERSKSGMRSFLRRERSQSGAPRTRLQKLRPAQPITNGTSSGANGSGSGANTTSSPKVGPAAANGVAGRPPSKAKPDTHRPSTPVVTTQPLHPPTHPPTPVPTHSAPHPAPTHSTPTQPVPTTPVSSQ